MAVLKKIITPDQTLNRIQDAIDEAIRALTGSVVATPSGVVAAFAGTTAPAGWLMCDGSAVLRSAYGTLFNTIGVTHGSGDGTTTFNLPDYRGRFLRGVDGAAGLDPDKASRTAMASGGNTGNNVGSVQSDAYQDHDHDTPVGNNTAAPWGLSGSSQANVLFGTALGTANTPWTSPASFHANTRTTTETRPVNAFVNWIIKI